MTYQSISSVAYFYLTSYLLSIYTSLNQLPSLVQPDELSVNILPVAYDQCLPYLLIKLY